jgi:hypothetical protein
MKEIEYNLDLGEVEFYKTQLNLILNIPKVRFNDCQLTLLSYIHIMGVTEATKAAVENKLYLSKNSIYNLLSKWRKAELLINGELNDGISILKADHTIKINLKNV